MHSQASKYQFFGYNNLINKLLNEEGDIMDDIVESNEVVQFKDGDFILDVKISSKGKTVWLNQVLTAIESIYFLNSCFLLCVWVWISIHEWWDGTSQGIVFI